MSINEIKARFGIIGNSPLLEHAINVAKQVATTEISVLISGESGVGKEVFPQIIHQLSPRKHGPYIAVNCGAIPEGTIDSELFGHEKGSFTGAHEARKGYFEVSNGGTIFLDEVGELPLNTQVRLLRVLETGEFIKVGSSKSQKTNVRVVAATNVDMLRAIENGKFREDLYYRLNTVPIRVPPLRDRKEDIHLIFRKFSHDFAERYRIPALSLQPEAMQILTDYRWPGNIRQLKNITEQMSILEKSRDVSADTLLNYLPPAPLNNLPVLMRDELSNSKEFNEREVLYKLIFEMKKEMNDLRSMVNQLMQHNPDERTWQSNPSPMIHELETSDNSGNNKPQETHFTIQPSAGQPSITVTPVQKHILVDESLSLTDKEKEFIQKALSKHKGRRKLAAKELGISERTLYRKMNEYGIH
ncbi:MAG TPA: sigma-54 dependent transcriptional regulator [Bacteroidia bacterium]|nr:sigma-54-dependent Fis family transcriptional regulator [Bacteroidota bacterium]MBP6335734.1 sigma-54-dependent Fis family transcriptional regulator [Bacteroidia bacterium]MBK8587260.1 sigma-54-dependent Fis family transcriptional regulator [Bacteroidota bacterium]MBP9924171.1 sigma-54-dependent Fis family transcriptional regulator [Bacteroidia bacterium]HQW00108.1 sigma-54 dependent transcriptional regulator [Bacteroidia bacterium]